MSCLKAIPILLWVFFGCFYSPADAQINLKTGYNISFLSNSSLDQVIGMNNINRSYTKGFGRLRWMHGFEGGARFKTGMHSLEVTYQGAYQALKATGQTPDGPYTDKLRFSIHSGALGYQVTDERWGAGIDLQYQFYKVKVTPEVIGIPFRNVQNMPGLKFYLMFTLQGDKGVDMALQPYYVLPFKEYDLSPLAGYFNVDPQSEDDRWTRFGLTMLFYNGKK